MPKAFVFLLLIFTVGALNAQEPQTAVLEDETLGTSYGLASSYFIDSNRKFDTIQDVLEADEHLFQPSTEVIPDFNFTSGRIWFKLKIRNQSSFDRFILETARPITNRVELYEFDNGQLINKYLAGDDFNYFAKPIKHRKNLFPVDIEQGQEKTYYLKMESDGELLFAPFIIYDRMQFFALDFKDQFKNGFYYGLIALVVIIYFFFFYFLRNKAFLFYVLYAFSQGMLQFSLDGYTHHHFFPDGGYFTNHILLFFAGLTVIFLLTYVSNYLELKERDKLFYRIFNILRLLMVGITCISLIPGVSYEISFPIINMASLVSVLLAAFTIVILRIKGFKVDFFFAIAFIILIIGGVIFILGNLSVVGDKIVSLGALKISSALEFVVLSISMSNKYGELQREKEEAQRVALKNLKEKNAVMDEANTRLEEEVKQRTAKIRNQNKALAESRNEIISSIRYAERIQLAILPPRKQIAEISQELFVFYQPKEAVSGDFYFVEQTQTTEKHPQKYIIIAAVDCTGHGVPGAFMSIVGNNLLQESLSEKEVNSPGEALDFLHKGVVKKLQRNIEGDIIRDGMDIAMCAVREDLSELIFAGARNPLYVIRKKSNLTENPVPSSALIREETNELLLFEVKGDRSSIGGLSDQVAANGHSNHVIQLSKGDKFFVFSDGYADQFGGERGKKFRYKRFRQLLLDSYAMNVTEQTELLQEVLDNWRGDTEQIDDILVMGMRIPTD